MDLKTNTKINKEIIFNKDKNIHMGCFLSLLNINKIIS